MIDVARDCLAIAALAAIGTGCWWLHPSAALITVGGLVLAALLLPTHKGNRDDT